MKKHSDNIQMNGLNIKKKTVFDAPKIFNIFKPLFK